MNASTNRTWISCRELGTVSKGPYPLDRGAALGSQGWSSGFSRLKAGFQPLRRDPDIRDVTGRTRCYRRIEAS